MDWTLGKTARKSLLLSILVASLLGLSFTPHAAVFKADTSTSAELSHRTTAVHGHVIHVTTEPYPKRPQHTRTRYRLIVWTASVATDVQNTFAPHIQEGAIIEVVMPGGERGGRMTVVAGVRHLSLGDEVVMNLERTPWGLSPRGYAMSTRVLRRDETGALLPTEGLSEHPLMRWLQP